MTYTSDKQKWYLRSVLGLLSTLAVLTWPANAQRRSITPAKMSSGDEVFSVCFSPDGRTLAIARGDRDPFQRFGRIELWDADSGQLRRVIKGFDGPVRSLSFSPDGKKLVSGSSEYRSSTIQEKAQFREGSVFNDLKWWDAQSGELKHRLTLPGKGSFTIQAIHSPDGTQLALVETFVEVSSIHPGMLAIPGSSILSRRPHIFFNASLRLLDAQTGDLKLKLKLDKKRPTRAMFTPDGKRIVAWNNEEVMFWNARTGQEDHKLKDFKGYLNSIAFSPDAELLAVASSEYEQRRAHLLARSEVRIFDLRTWKMTLHLTNLGAVNSLAFAPGGRVLLVGGLIFLKGRTQPAVKLFDLQKGTSGVIRTGSEDFSEAVDSLVLSRNGSLLALQSGASTVKVLDTQAWKMKQSFDANSIGNDNTRPASPFVLSVRRVVAIAFSADGNTLSGELEQGEVKVWDHRTGEVKKQLDAGEEEPTLVTIAADGKTVAEVSNGTLRVGNVSGETKRTVLQPGDPPITAIALSADGQTLAAGVGNDLKLLEVATGQLLKASYPRRTPATRLEFSSDGRTLASADKEGTIEVWDLEGERIEKTIKAVGRVSALRFSPNGQALATAGEDHAVTLWDLRTGLPKQKLQKHDAPVNALAFSLDGQLLASGGDDRSVVIWETASGKSRRTLKGHDQTVASLAFSHDGRLLASGSGNASVVLWEVMTGKVNRVLR